MLKKCKSYNIAEKRTTREKQFNVSFKSELDAINVLKYILYDLYLDTIRYNFGNKTGIFLKSYKLALLVSFDVVEQRRRRIERPAS